MKTCLHLFFILLFCQLSSIGQTADSSLRKLPLVSLKTLDDKNFTTAELTNDGKPVIIIFWKSCCPPNINMLDEISEVYSDWQKETGVVIYAVSIDDARNSSKVASLVNGKDWEFKILLDVNSDFKRAMSVNESPHVFILNKNLEVIWQKKTYNPGEANEIYKFIKSIK